MSALSTSGVVWIRRNSPHKVQQLTLAAQLEGNIWVLACFPVLLAGFDFWTGWI